MNVFDRLGIAAAVLCLCFMALCMMTLPDNPLPDWVMLSVSSLAFALMMVGAIGNLYLSVRSYGRNK